MGKTLVLTTALPTKFFNTVGNMNLLDATAMECLLPDQLQRRGLTKCDILKSTAYKLLQQLSVQ